MFTVNDTTYTLKYNTKKIKTIEAVTKTSIVGEVTKSNGLMPYATLEALFSFALVGENTNEVVKQKEAAEMFEKVVEENGLITVNAAIIEKLQDDLGFYVPVELIESDLPNTYNPTPLDIKKAELARDFSYERDLAFFVVQIGMSRTEFDQLTEKEKMFIRKEYENKFLSDTTWLRNAVLNAEANVNRKKGKKFIDLFPKKQKADKEYNENAIATVLEIEKVKGKSWVDKVYVANGMKKPITAKEGGN